MSIDDKKTICSICKLHLIEKNDTVVCPDCGALYHRDCYAKNGECVLKDTHNKKIEKAPESKGENTSNFDINLKEIVCSSCSNSNPEENIFCDYCGEALRREIPQKKSGESKSTKHAKSTNPKNQIKENEKKDIENISTDDYIRYVGNKSDYFLPVFELMEKENVKVTWNWSAFLGGPFYFFYRKMYSVSIPLFILYAFYAGASLFFYTEFTKFSFINALENIRRGVLAFSPITIPDNIIWVYQFLYFLRFFIFVSMIISGLFANLIYRDYVMDDILTAKKLKLKKIDYYKLLRETGGTNQTAVIVLISVLAILAITFFFFTTINIYNKLF